MSTLYRDYRPENFTEILGQQHIKITLQNEISTDHLAQAFLFCGPRAVGKTTMARVLAKSVNCTNRKSGEYEPCGKCDNCLDIKNGKHLDIIEIDAASNTGVDNVRENIISFSRISPSRAKYKVFIIDEVHMLSPSAFNALLKIIEEPPTYVMFILATTEVHKVPYTIISRCERFDFRRIGVLDVVSKLKLIAQKEGKEIDLEVLEAVARRSGGHLRDAESLLGQIFSLGDKKISLEQAELLMPHYNNNEAISLLEHFSKKDTAKALAMINSLVDSGVSIRNFISELIFMLRKISISKISPQLSDDLGLNLGDSFELKLNELTSKLSLNQLIFYIKRLLVAYNDKNQLILQLPLELAAIEICQTNSYNNKSVSGEDLPESQPRNSSSLNNNSTNNNSRNDNPVSSQPLKKESSSDEKSVESIDTFAPSQANRVVHGKIKLENKSDNNFNLNCEQVLEKWPEFLIKIKKYNHSLSFVLQNCDPREIKSGTLRLAFKYKFHQDRVKDETIKRLIESTLIEVYNNNVKVQTELNENKGPEEVETTDNNEEEVKVYENSQDINNRDNKDLNKKSVKADESLMNNLLKTFGGEVIN